MIAGSQQGRLQDSIRTFGYGCDLVESCIVHLSLLLFGQSLLSTGGTAAGILLGCQFTSTAAAAVLLKNFGADAMDAIVE
jgi:hypothetical protein